MERVWLQKANSIRASTNAASRNASSNINLITDEEVFVSREDYDAAIITWYLAEQGQGNGEGPSRN